MSDLIDRQAVLDTIHLFFTEEIDKIPTKKTEDGEVLVIHKCQPLFAMNKAICKRIKALTSASPTQNCVGNALDMRCDDAISRQKVLDVINLNWDYRRNCIRAIEKLSPVKQEPKTGHWEWLTEDKYRCSNCNFKTRVDEYMNEPMYEFCPFCGAKMIEPQESEV